MYVGADEGREINPLKTILNSQIFLHILETEENKSADLAIPSTELEGRIFAPKGSDDCNRRGSEKGKRRNYQRRSSTRTVSARGNFKGLFAFRNRTEPIA